MTSIQHEYLYPDEIWKSILSYNTEYKVLKEKAINLIKHHTKMPFALSLHNFKGLKSNLDYHKTHNIWIFKVLDEDYIKEIINKTEQELRT